MKLENKKKATLKDIGKALGLTPSAVSKALINHPRISDKTKLAVKEMVSNLDYHPNMLSSALRKGKSNLVGIIVPKVNNDYYSSVVENIENVLNKNGYNIIMTQSNESYTKECENIDSLLNIQVAGIIASIANETVNFDYFKKVKSKGIPLVLFDRVENELEVDYVGVDNYHCSQLIVEHLVSQGYKRIAHITGISHTQIYKDRIRGFKDALQKYNLPIIEELIIECNLQIEDGRRIMHQLLRFPDRPDAVYAASDFAALGALQVLLEEQYSVPMDMGLVGFGDESFSSIMRPAISSININSSEIGKSAAYAFLNSIKNATKEVGGNKIILDVKLIVRDSSDKQ